MNKKAREYLGDMGDLTLSITPELSTLLTPQIVDNPEAALLTVGGAILKSKLQKFYAEFKNRKSKN